MLANAIALALFDEHAIDPLVEIVLERHVGDSGFRVANRQEPRQLASRLGHRDGPRARRRRSCFRALLCAVYKLS